MENVSVLRQSYSSGGSSSSSGGNNENMASNQNVANSGTATNQASSGYNASEGEGRIQNSNYPGPNMGMRQPQPPGPGMNYQMNQPLGQAPRFPYNPMYGSSRQHQGYTNYMGMERQPQGYSDQGWYQGGYRSPGNYGDLPHNQYGIQRSQYNSTQNMSYMNPPVYNQGPIGADGMHMGQHQSMMGNDLPHPGTSQSRDSMTSQESLSNNTRQSEKNSSDSLLTSILSGNMSGPMNNMSGPASNMSGMSNNMSCPANNSISGPASNMSGPASNMSGPASNMSGPASNMSGPASNISGPASNISGPASNMSGPASNMSGQEKNIASPASVASNSGQNSSDSRTNVPGDEAATNEGDQDSAETDTSSQGNEGESRENSKLEAAAGNNMTANEDDLGLDSSEQANESIQGNDVPLRGSSVSNPMDNNPSILSSMNNMSGPNYSMSESNYSMSEPNYSMSVPSSSMGRPSYSMSGPPSSMAGPSNSMAEATDTNNMTGSDYSITNISGPMGSSSGSIFSMSSPTNTMSAGPMNMSGQNYGMHGSNMNYRQNIPAPSISMSGPMNMPGGPPNMSPHMNSMNVPGNMQNYRNNMSYPGNNMYYHGNMQYPGNNMYGGNYQGHGYHPSMRNNMPETLVSQGSHQPQGSMYNPSGNPNGTPPNMGMSRHTPGFSHGNMMPVRFCGPQPHNQQYPYPGNQMGMGSPMSPLPIRSPGSMHSNQSVHNPSPGPMQSPINLGADRGPNHSSRSSISSPGIRSPNPNIHPRQMCSPTTIGQAATSPASNSMSQSIVNQSPHASPLHQMNSSQNPSQMNPTMLRDPEFQRNFHFNRDVPQGNCQPAFMNQGSPPSPSTSKTYTNLSKPSTSTSANYNVHRRPGFNPLQSLQKLAMLPDNQVVDPKSVVGDASMLNPEEMSRYNEMYPNEGMDLYHQGYQPPMPPGPYHYGDRYMGDSMNFGHNMNMNMNMNMNDNMRYYNMEPQMPGMDNYGTPPLDAQEVPVAKTKRGRKKKKDIMNDNDDPMAEPPEKPPKRKYTKRSPGRKPKNPKDPSDSPGDGQMSSKSPGRTPGKRPPGRPPGSGSKCSVMKNLSVHNEPTIKHCTVELEDISPLKNGKLIYNINDCGLFSGKLNDDDSIGKHTRKRSNENADLKGTVLLRNGLELSPRAKRSRRRSGHSESDVSPYKPNGYRLDMTKANCKVVISKMKSFSSPNSAILVNGSSPEKLKEMNIDFPMNGLENDQHDFDTNSPQHNYEEPSFLSKQDKHCHRNKSPKPLKLTIVGGIAKCSGASLASLTSETEHSDNSSFGTVDSSNECKLSNVGTSDEDTICDEEFDDVCSNSDKNDVKFSRVVCRRAKEFMCVREDSSERGNEQHGQKLLLKLKVGGGGQIAVKGSNEEISRDCGLGLINLSGKDTRSEYYEDKSMEDVTEQKLLNRSKTDENRLAYLLQTDSQSSEDQDKKLLDVKHNIDGSYESDTAKSHTDNDSDCSQNMCSTNEVDHNNTSSVPNEFNTDVIDDVVSGSQVNQSESSDNSSVCDGQHGCESQIVCEEDVKDIKETIDDADLSGDDLERSRVSIEFESPSQSCTVKDPISKKINGLMKNMNDSPRNDASSSMDQSHSSSHTDKDYDSGICNGTSSTNSDSPTKVSDKENPTESDVRKGGRRRKLLPQTPNKFLSYSSDDESVAEQPTIPKRSRKVGSRSPKLSCVENKKLSGNFKAVPIEHIEEPTEQMEVLDKVSHSSVLDCSMKKGKPKKTSLDFIVNRLSQHHSHLEKQVVTVAPVHVSNSPLKVNSSIEKAESDNTSGNTTTRRSRRNSPGRAKISESTTSKSKTGENGSGLTSKSEEACAVATIDLTESPTIDPGEASVSQDGGNELNSNSMDIEHKDETVVDSVLEATKAADIELVSPSDKKSKKKKATRLRNKNGLPWVNTKRKRGKSKSRQQPFAEDDSDHEKLKKVLKLNSDKLGRKDCRQKADAQLQKGPYLKVKGPKDQPSTCEVINLQHDDTDSKNKKSKNRSKPESHLEMNSEAVSKMSKTKPWICAFCGQTSNEAALGDLFGPYFLEASEAISSPITIDSNSPKPGTSKDSSPGKTKNKKGTSARKLHKGKNGKTPSPCKSVKHKQQTMSSPTSSDCKTQCEIWIHEDCIVWTSGVYAMGGKIHGLEDALCEAVNSICSVCKNSGATLGCFQKGCSQKYHYICAVRKDCCFDEENFSLLCPKHKEKKVKSTEATVPR